MNASETTLANVATNERLERARKRAKDLREFYAHITMYLIVYVVMTAGLFTINPGGSSPPTMILQASWATGPDPPHVTAGMMPFSQLPSASQPVESILEDLLSTDAKTRSGYDA